MQSLRNLRRLLCPVSEDSAETDEGRKSRGSSGGVMGRPPQLPADPVAYPENRLGEFWRRKLRTSFARLNRSGSGLLTRDDFAAMGREMARLGGLGGRRAADIQEVMLSIWEDYYRPADAGAPGITAEEYVRQKCAVVNGRLRADVGRYGRRLFGAMDHDGDGRISRDEYRIFTAAWGIGDRARDEMFELMRRSSGGCSGGGGGDGDIAGVSEAAFVGALADFYISEDHASPYARLFGDLDC